MKNLLMGRTWYLSLFASAIMGYLIVTGTYDWKLWVVFSVIVVERALVQLAQWAFRTSLEASVKRISDQLAKSLEGFQQS